MTVKELIEELKNYPPSYSVVLSVYTCGNTFREDLTLRRITVDYESVVIDAEDN